jgi:chemotaxis protein CheD
MRQRYQEVGIGEIKIGSGQEQLRVMLGSCVGIGFIWRKGGRCGLAHCLLPEAPAVSPIPCGRYVDQAIPSLLRLMRLQPADYRDVEVVLAGGASMFDRTLRRFQIGKLNIAAAQKHLSDAGLYPAFCDLGGHSGRFLTIDCARHSFAIKELPKHCKEMLYARA